MLLTHFVNDQINLKEGKGCLLYYLNVGVLTLAIKKAFSEKFVFSLINLAELEPSLFW